ncbi:hypothetical protein MRX96_015008 [Rhipicephalus microplus]
MCSGLPSDEGFKVAADNFFSSLHLVEELASRGIQYVGTLRQNRLKDCQIIEEKALKKLGQRSHDYRVNNKNGLAVVRWFDRKEVTLVSNFASVELMETVKRYDRNAKKHNDTGLVVLPEQPWLACSPDGLMRYEGNTVLVEIKCPARCEKVPIIDKEGKTILEFFDCQARTLTLKKSHSFYTQLQLQLYIMNLSQALFYAWSPVQDDKFLFVDRDMNFLSEVVPKLEFFYFTYLLEELSKTT